ncbi:MAG: lpxC, partial [Bacteroidetes bacterium]|nr:lpxC [Bacteroidota bacterium]
MLVQQRTIKQPISLSGVGLHTGSISTMTFRPAPENSGIRFRRIDMGGTPEIPANVDHVVDISRGTTIGIGEARVHTIEHVMAALVGLQVDNVLIDIDANEPPIGDGSSKPYVDALMSAEFEKQDAPKDYLIIDQTVTYHNEEKKVDIVALPLDDYRLTVMVDYFNPALGSQHTGLFNLEKEFVTEFAPCRTFCFLHEVEMLHSAGLIKGGNLDNAIVIVDRDLPDEEIKRISSKLGIGESVILGTNGVLNNKSLHFRNEPARHKLLDLMGDLALIGVPLKAQILAARPGHASNIEFARQIRKLYQQKKLIRKYQHERKEGVVFDINAIKKILPHRYPFLLVDKITDFKVDESVVGVKNV